MASHCNFSRFYFSKMFKMEMGEGVHEFIKRVKMEQRNIHWQRACVR
ncbi:MAG: AraC family transcriptional regulator [Oscillospiraceae bacterium]